MTIEVHFEDGTDSRYPMTYADAIRLITRKYGTCITDGKFYRDGDHESQLAYDDDVCHSPVAEIRRYC